MEIVTVADVDAEDRVRNSLLQIWGLRFGHKSKLLFILSTRFGQDFGERCLLARVLHGCIKSQSFLIFMLRIIFYQSVHHWSWSSLCASDGR